MEIEERLQITAGRVVVMFFTLTDEDGNILDQSLDGSFSYLHGAQRILPALERALEGKEEGDNLNLEFPPADGFGEYVPDLTEIAPRALFKGADVQPGMEFKAKDRNGRILPLKIVRVEGDDIHVDANHPNAGKTLFFDVQILIVRHATPEELAGH
jgi:FKBP-type peptidyl-prolyl cis-trans isomerase SlyD